jgi:AcrR family transcriptional regulator
MTKRKGAGGSSRGRGRPPGPNRDPGERREELLVAAVVAIRDHGADASMTDIADAAGITKPILYRHFGDRAGLAQALAERAVAQLSTFLAERLTADLPPRERMREAIGAFVSFTEEEAALYAFLVRGADGDDGLVEGIARQIATVLAAGLRQIGADSGPAELWSHAIIGAVFSGAQWWKTRGISQRDQLVDDLTALLWDGLASTGLDAAGRRAPGAEAT